MKVQITSTHILEARGVLETTEEGAGGVQVEAWQYTHELKAIVGRFNSRRAEVSNSIIQ